MSTNIIIIMGAGGRMGRTIAELVMADADLTLAGVVERPGRQSSLECYSCTKSTDLDALLTTLKNAIVIDFTAPEATMNAAAIAARHGAPIVMGTTGLSAEQKDTLASLAAKAPMLWSPNMSVGVNVLLSVLPKLAQLLGEEYDMEMVELHHNRKADAPSGTALRLAECLAEARGWNLDETGNYCRHGIIGARPQKEIGVQTIRGGDVVGVHTVYFMGQGERIEVTHQAHSREMFARGAIRAAKWLASQPAGKLYAMTDVLAKA